MDTQSVNSVIRFGLGRRGQEPLPTDPQAWLKAQIEQPDPVRYKPMPSALDALRAWQLDASDPVPAGQPKRIVRINAADQQVEIENALTTTAPFRERLVWFWTNHFTVSYARQEVYMVLGAYVREAIRPHVTGKFRDMLLAVMRHPAMLLYLDNWLSAGPNSRAAKALGTGLNENLGRECMELHTISPAAGYHQADVTSFSKVITGWTFETKGYRTEPGTDGFVFNTDLHEPGPKTVMGRVYPEGEQGGIDALNWFAAHPSTHNFLATKLVRHFVADDPTPQEVKRIAGVLRDTDGDLGAAALEVTQLPRAWTPLSKLRTPQDYVIAAVRALDRPPEQRANVLDGLVALGQPLWSAPLPNGWSDHGADWVTPAALLARAQWVYSLAGSDERVDPEAIAEAALGPLLKPATVGQLHAAGSRRDALTLLMTAPEFQRR